MAAEPMGRVKLYFQRARKKFPSASKKIKSENILDKIAWRAQERALHGMMGHIRQLMNERANSKKRDSMGSAIKRKEIYRIF